MTWLSTCFPWRRSFGQKPAVYRTDSTFDALSNEIVLQIFDYFSWHEIQFSFGALNRRLDGLIETYPHAVDLLAANNYPNQLRSLKINRSYQLSTFSNFSLDQLSTVRSLALSNLKAADVRAVLRSMPIEQLEYIYLGICPTYGEPTGRKLVQSVQKEILSLGIHRLRHCYLKETCDRSIDDLPRTLPALRSLQLLACPSFSVLSQYLARAPNLRSLRACILEGTNEPLVPIQCRITRLSLRPHFHCLPKDLTHFIRQCCPYLEKLTIEVYPFASLQSNLSLDRNQWEMILPPDLTEFCWMTIPTPNISPIEPLIQSFKPFYAEKLTLISHDQRVHVCLATIDPLLMSAWTRC